MSPLEERYRRLLRVLPEPARTRWADDMTDTFLAGTADPDPEYAEFGSPSVTDRLDVWWLAVRLRLGGPGSTLRAAAAGTTVRLVALLGAVGLAATSALALVASTAFRATTDLPYAHTWRTPVSSTAAVLLVVLLGCLLRGSWATHPVAVLVMVLAVVQAAGPFFATSLPWLLTVVVPALAAVLAEPDLQPRPGRWWAAAGGVAVLAAGLPWLTAVAAGLPLWLDQGGVWALVLTGVFVAAVRVGSGPLQLAVAVLAASWLPIVTVAGIAGGGPIGYGATQLGAAALLAAVTVVGGVRGVAAVRRLPAGATG